MLVTDQLVLDRLHRREMVWQQEANAAHSGSEAALRSTWCISMC